MKNTWQKMKHVSQMISIVAHQISSEKKTELSLTRAERRLGIRYREKRDEKRKDAWNAADKALAEHIRTKLNPLYRRYRRLDAKYRRLQQSLKY